MSLAPDPNCNSCRSPTAQDLPSIVCTECNQLCCRACFGLPEEGDSVDDDGVDPDQDELARVKRTKFARVCSKCRGVGKDAKEHVSELLSINQEQLPTVEQTDTNDEPTTTSVKAQFGAAQRTIERAIECYRNISLTDLGVKKEEPAPEGDLELTQERCLLHDKDWKLYCMSCDVLVCESCFWNEGPHMRHTIDFVEKVYVERRATIEQKLEQLDEKVKDLQKDAARCEKNLQIVQEEERSVQDEIDRVCTEAKRSLAEITDGRKQTLQMRVDFPANVQKLNDSLQEMFRQLSPAEFMKRQPQIDKQCDEMLGESVPREFSPKPSEDIGCELVPPYDMHKFNLDKYERTTEWPLQLITVAETRWTVALRKKGTLLVKVTPHSEEVLQLPFKLLIVIPHQDLLKTIRKTFNIQGASEELQVVSNAQLVEEGFIEKSNLVVEIGLRPLNAVVQALLYKQQLIAMRKTVQTTITHMKTFNKDLDPIFRSNQIYFTHYHDLNYSKLKSGDYDWESTNITDSAGRQWYLTVYRLISGYYNHEWTDLQAHIVLRNGMKTKCRCFIELMHTDSKKNVLKIWEHKFEKFNTKSGWDCFIERWQLRCDSGFYPDGVLHFRFGVLPFGS